MRRKKINEVVVHVVPLSHGSVSEMINELHLQVIENRIEQCNFTTEQKVDIINKIIKKITDANNS